MSESKPRHIQNSTKAQASPIQHARPQEGKQDKCLTSLSDSCDLGGLGVIPSGKTPLRYDASDPEVSDPPYPGLEPDQLPLHVVFSTSPILLKAGSSLLARLLVVFMVFAEYRLMESESWSIVLARRTPTRPRTMQTSRKERLRTIRAASRSLRERQRRRSLRVLSSLVQNRKRGRSMSRQERLPSNNPSQPQR